jgi:hypothetical protein
LAAHAFVTIPQAQDNKISTASFRFIAFGDMGTGDIKQLALAKGGLPW